MQQNRLGRTSVHTGEWVNRNGDLLPSIREGFDKLKSKGAELGAWKDMRLGSIVFGWEVPGLFIGSMLMKNLSLRMQSDIDENTTPPPPPPAPTYQWRTTDFNGCTKACEGGIQSHWVLCMDGLKAVDEGLCSGTKPLSKRTCNTQYCPPNNNLPEGYVGKYENGKIKGWAWDADHPTYSIKVHVYRTVNGVKKFYKGIPTNILRNDVNRARNTSGNHGFILDFPAADRKPGVQFRFYGIDPSGKPNKEFNK